MSTQVYESIASRINNTELVIPTNGNAFLMRVRGIPWGHLAKVLVQQSFGTPVAFTVDALNSSLGLTPGEINPASLPPGWPMYKIMDQLTGTSGGLAKYFPAFGNPFRNMSGPDPVRSGVSQAGLGTGFTNAPRDIYLLIQPASGAGANSRWEAAATIFTDVGT